MFFMCLYFEKQVFYFEGKKVCRMMQINNLKITFTNLGHSNVNPNSSQALNMLNITTQLKIIARKILTSMFC